MIFPTLTTRHDKGFNQHTGFYINTVEPPMLVALWLTKHFFCFVFLGPTEEIYSTTSLQQNGFPPFVDPTLSHKYLVLSWTKCTQRLWAEKHLALKCGHSEPTFREKVTVARSNHLHPMTTGRAVLFSAAFITVNARKYS